MSKILKNTTQSDITINDTGMTITTLTDYTIPATEYPLWAASENVLTHITSGDIVVNDGNQDLSAGDAIDHLRGYIPKQVGITNSAIAITKPEGGAKTFISHNFCDNTTWPTTSDSKWSLTPPSGKIYRVYKAEVQFSSDVQMATATPAKQMKLDVMVAGTADPNESKVFSSITDVFDLGNKHYTMDVTVDGVPGMTTVVFDYTNTIILYSAYAMSMDFYIADHTELGGSHCSVSLVAELVDE